jgi:hypothetical protein
MWSDMAPLLIAQSGEPLTPSQALRRQIRESNTARVEIRLIEEEREDWRWLGGCAPDAGVGRFIVKSPRHFGPRGDGREAGRSELLAESTA